MTVYNWSQLTNGQILAFSPTGDKLVFDDFGVDASAVNVVWSGSSNIQFSYGGYTIDLLADAKSLTTTNVIFINGSRLIIGDNATGVTGDDGANYAWGSAKGDQIYGLGGNDTIYGGNGNNLLNGGDGNDSIYGGAGNDTLIGGSGVDWLEGGYGDDVYVISNRDVYIYDAGGNDTAIVNVDFVKIPSKIEHVTYANGAKALPYWIDALLPDDAASYRTLLGPTKTFNYFYPTALPSYDTVPNDQTGFQPFNAQQKAFSQKALAYISSTIDLRFAASSSSDNPNTIDFANNAQTDSAGYSYFPDTEFIGSDIFIDSSADNLSPADGNYSALVLIHELGHALGLKHPFDDGSGNNTGPYLSSAEDKSAWTVMSYNSSSIDYHLEYSDLDIAALQYLYGPSKTARTGDDAYMVNPLTSNFIWDGGGVDTLSAQGVDVNATLYLEPGYWGYVGQKSDLITAPGQVTVNFGTVIENLIGGAGNDHLYGNGVDNVITGGLGDDTIDGGDGIDTAVYQGTKAQYVITRLSDGSLTVHDTVAGRDGTDTLTNVELLTFKDGALNLSGPKATVGDFNGDGHSDILLQNATNGACFLWEMNGLGFLSDKSFGYVGWSPGNVWQAKGAGDFNGDGKSDILLQNATDGSCFIWEMNGGSFLSDKSFGFVGWTPGKDWQVKATGDFNGDGKSDILLQNATNGACFVWEMNGGSFLNDTSFGSAGWTPGKDWQVKATGDFNGDGKSDILLQNATDGSCFIWEMNGLSLFSPNSYGTVGWTPGKDWQVKATGDFNGDGKSDILLQNAVDGSCFVWEMNGLNLLGASSYGTVGWTPGKDWQVVSTGDYNNDGKTDILLQNANSGACFVWEMNGLSLLDARSYGAVGWATGSDWHVAA